MGAIVIAELPGDPTSRWAFICLCILTIIYVVVRPILKKKDPLAKAPTFASLSQQRSVERQMQNVLVELSEMARQITAQLDTRSTKLELLIKDADDRLAKLRAASAENFETSAGGGGTNLGAGNSEGNAVVPADAADAAVDAAHVEVYVLADQGRTSLEISRQLNRPRGEVELILALRR